MRNAESRWVKQTKTYPRYLMELAADVIEGSTGTGCPRGVIREYGDDKVTDLDPFLGSGSPQDISTVRMIVKSGNYGAGSLARSRLRQCAVGAVQKWLFLQLKSLFKQSGNSSSCVRDNLISPECVTPPRLLNTALRGGVTNFVTFTCLHHANNANVK